VPVAPKITEEIFSTRLPVHLYAMWPNEPNAHNCCASN